VAEIGTELRTRPERLAVDVRRAALGLQDLCEGPLRGMFDGPTTAGLDLDAKLLVLDLHAVRDSPAVGILMGHSTRSLSSSATQTDVENELTSLPAIAAGESGGRVRVEDPVLEVVGRVPAHQRRIEQPDGMGHVLRGRPAFRAATEHGEMTHVGLETVPLVRVVNLARAIDRLKEAGFWICGLDEAAPQLLAELDLGRIHLGVGGGDPRADRCRRGEGRPPPVPRHDHRRHEDAWRRRAAVAAGLLAAAGTSLAAADD